MSKSSCPGVSQSSRVRVRVLSNGESEGIVVPGKFFLKNHFFFFLFVGFEEKPVVLEYQEIFSSDEDVF